MKNLFLLTLVFCLIPALGLGQENDWIQNPDQIRDCLAVTGSSSSYGQNPRFAQQAANFDGRLRMTRKVEKLSQLLIAAWAKDCQSIHSSLGSIFQKEHSDSSMTLKGVTVLRYSREGRATHCLMVMKFSHFLSTLETRVTSILLGDETLNLEKRQKRWALRRLDRITGDYLKKHNQQAKWALEKDQLIALKADPEKRIEAMERKIERLSKRVEMLEGLLIQRYLQDRRVIEEILSQHNSPLLKKINTTLALTEAMKAQMRRKLEKAIEEAKKEPLPPIKVVKPYQPSVIKAPQPLKWWEQTGSISIQGYAAVVVGSQKIYSGDTQSARMQARTYAMLQLSPILKGKFAEMMSRWNRDCQNLLNKNALVNFSASEEALKQVVNGSLAKCKVVYGCQMGDRYCVMVGVDTGLFIDMVQELLETMAQDFILSESLEDAFLERVKKLAELEKKKTAREAKHHLLKNSKGEWEVFLIR